MKIGSQQSTPLNPDEEVNGKSEESDKGYLNERSVSVSPQIKQPYLTLGEQQKSSTIVQKLKTVLSFKLIKDRKVTVVHPDETKLKQSTDTEQLDKEDYSIGQKTELPTPKNNEKKEELQKIDQQLLLTKPKRSETEHSWAQRVLSQNSIQAGKNYCQQRISLEIEPDQLSYYNDLQKTIATLIPKESHRPTIDLLIIGKSARQNNGQQCQLGVLGGIGPLSDAKIATRALDDFVTKGGDKDYLRMNVLSCPPPRTLWEYAASGSSYVDNIRAFAARQHQSYAIASNTAHSYWSRLNKLGMEPLLHLVDQVASRIAKEQGPTTNTTTLVLGTTQTYKNKLYPLALKPHKVHSINLSESDQKDLQKLIDHTKKTGGSDKKEELSSIIRRYVNSERDAGREVGHVLLGCTELPMALGKEKMEELEAELQIALVNTEAVFAEIFAEKLNEAQR